MKKIFLKYKEIILYLVFGVLSTIVSLASYYLVTMTILDPNNAIYLQIANIFSWICAVTFAYITNRKYVFESKNKDKFNEIIKFVGARVITLIIDMLIMGISVSALGLNDKIMKIVSQIVIIILNYIFSKVFVFKKQK